VRRKCLPPKVAFLFLTTKRDLIFPNEANSLIISWKRVSKAEIGIFLVSDELIKLDTFMKFDDFALKINN